MSGDQSTIFGDSTAQPPTPRQTPTSPTSFHSSTNLDTPQIGTYGSSNTSTTPGIDWTPRFTEEFSVFNTPGNFRGSHEFFNNFVTPFASPTIPDSAALALSPSASKLHKRVLSSGNFIAESSNVNAAPALQVGLSLLAVEPSRQLPNSPGSLALEAPSSTTAAPKEPAGDREPGPDHCGSASHSSGSPRATKAAKKARGETAADSGKNGPDSGRQATRTPARSSPPLVQTATPPHSATKTVRKLAPKLVPVTSFNMQNDQGFGAQSQPQPDFMNTPQRQPMGTFINSPADLFNSFPMSAPPSATPFGDARSFWPGSDTNMAGMDMDFTFGTPNTVQRQLDAIDWAQASQATQSYMIGAQHGLQHMPMTSVGSPRQLMPTALDTASASHHALYSGTYPTPVDDPFGVVPPNAGVNPGLLLSCPPSSNMNMLASAPPGALETMALADSSMFDTHQGLPMSTAPRLLQITQSSPPQNFLGVPSEGRETLRRSASSRDLSQQHTGGDRTLASSPVKSSARPALGRTQSENRGRLRGRASLPTLAPAVTGAGLTQSQTTSILPSSGTQPSLARSASFGGGRPTGRCSPVRMHQRQQQFMAQQHMDPHARLTGLTSIPEINTPQARSSVKFMIDASGRARVEASAHESDSGAPSTLKRNPSAPSLNGRARWDSSTEGDDSSSDDEPIIIPSRTTSFALPDPIKPTRRVPLHSSQRSVSDRSTTSTVASANGESEPGSVLDDVPKGAGDAASELEKLRQMRPKRMSLPVGVNGLSGAGNLFGSVQIGLPFGGPLGNRGHAQTQTQGHGHGHGHGHGQGNMVTPRSQSLHSLEAAQAQAKPAPSAAAKSHGIRCICGTQDAPPMSDGFIVQCESCDMWLHGRCISITKRTLPAVYICAFCAQTPTAHTMRMPTGMMASSPLAHKSFKSFR